MWEIDNILTFVHFPMIVRRENPFKIFKRLAGLGIDWSYPSMLSVWPWQCVIDLASSGGESFTKFGASAYPDFANVWI